MAGTYQVIVTSDARQDLAEILDYISENQSLRSARKVQNAILNAIDLLEQMPTMHAPLSETYELVGDMFRRVLADKYRVIFSVEEVIATVFVVRIFHIRRGPEFIIEELL